MTEDDIPPQDLRIRYPLLVKTQILRPFQIHHRLTAYAQ